MKSLKLIKPCKENWFNMTKIEKDKFCSRCSKTVIDFSNLSQKEILEHFKSAKRDICARITKEQINTPIFEIERTNQIKMPFSKFAASILLASSIITTQSCETNEVTHPIHIEQKSNDSNNSKQKITKKNLSEVSEINKRTPLLFKGNIVSQKTNKPLQNAKIVFITLLKTYSTFTDVEGKFSLEIPSNLIKDKNVVRISFQNIFTEYDDKNITLDNRYKTENLVLSKKEINDSFSFTAQPQVFYLGGVNIDHTRKKINPIVLINGVEFKYEEFQKARRGKISTCNLENKDYLYFEAEPAIALYGEDAAGGLFLLTDAN